MNPPSAFILYPLSFSSDLPALFMALSTLLLIFIGLRDYGKPFRKHRRSPR